MNSLALVCIGVAVLLSSFSLVNADNGLSGIFDLRTLSMPAPPPTSIFEILPWIAILVVISAVVAALVLKRRRKLIAIVALALVIVIAVSGLVWFVRASIYYSFDGLYTYPREGDNYFTVNSQNTGYVQGSFSLVIELTNASFSTKTIHPYQQLDNSKAKFDYTLQPKEKQYTDVYFTIHDNATSFSISLSYQSSGDFLITSDSLGDTYVNYAKAPFDDNFTSQRPPPPP